MNDRRLSRRKTLRQAAAGLFWCIMWPSARQRGDEWENLITRSFHKAQLMDSEGHSWLADDFIPTRQDIPTLAGLNGMLGSEYDALHYYMQFNSSGNLARGCSSIVNRVRTIVGGNRADWDLVRPPLEYLWRQFFGGSHVGATWPGFVILMPNGYVTTRHSFGLNGKRPKLTMPEAVKPILGPTLTLRFGTFWPDFDISVSVDQLRLRVPPGRDSKWAKPVVRWIQRSYSSDQGRRLPGETILQIGRAAPDDEDALKKGHYYPNTESKQVIGSNGLACFTREMTVLVLARLVPVTSFYDAIVHQMSISISGNYLLDINCVHRLFEHFIEHYPGIADIVVEALAR